MRRRYGSVKQFDANMQSEDINPLEGVANLADVMLVLACGLMLALIINWNVDVSGSASGAVSVEQGQEITDIAGPDPDSGVAPNADAQYEQYATVYRDAVTGKLYMVTEDE